MIVMLLQTFGVILLNALAAAGRWFTARLRKPYWAAGYAAGLLVLIFIALPNYIYILNFKLPFSAVMSGRNEFVLMGLGAGLMLATLIRKTDKRTYKIGLSMLLTLGVAVYSIGPFCLPMILVTKHERMETRWSGDVCVQTTEYTCGPAAAVTALRRLGIEGSEGRIAIACATTSTTGTQPDSLAEGLEDQYGTQGLKCDYRYFKDLDELAAVHDPVITVIDFSFLVDHYIHYITILEVRDDAVIAGDPLQGTRVMTHDEFLKVWKHAGVVCRRKI